MPVTIRDLAEESGLTGFRGTMRAQGTVILSDKLAHQIFGVPAASAHSMLLATDKMYSSLPGSSFFTDLIERPVKKEALSHMSMVQSIFTPPFLFFVAVSLFAVKINVTGQLSILVVFTVTLTNSYISDPSIYSVVIHTLCYYQNMENKFYSLFPTEKAYKDYVFSLKWKGGIFCPFCSSKYHTPLQNFKYHCNSCNSNYSLSVNTVMHNTKLDMRKWLISLDSYLSYENLSYRRLSEILQVDKKTAYRILLSLSKLFKTHKLDVVVFLGLNRNIEEVLTHVLLINTRKKGY